MELEHGTLQVARDRRLSNNRRRKCPPSLPEVPLRLRPSSRNERSPEHMRSWRESIRQLISVNSPQPQFVNPLTFFVADRPRYCTPAPIWPKSARAGVIFDYRLGDPPLSFFPPRVRHRHRDLSQGSHAYDCSRTFRRRTSASTEVLLLYSMTRQRASLESGFSHRGIHGPGGLWRVDLGVHCEAMHPHIAQ